MYCSHFNLKKKPFQLSSDNSFLWLGNTHAGALGFLKRGIDGPQRLLVLTGDIGTGKTTLIHELLHSLPRETAVAHITDPSIERHYFFLSIAQGLGFENVYQEGEEFAPVLTAFLDRRRQAREKCLIVIDEVHLIPERFLALLLSWSELAPDNTLTIILAGQLEFHGVMEKALGYSWQKQVDIHTMLSPLEEKQTREYILRRLELAGATQKIFTSGAFREVHSFSKGIPRRINIACDQAMIAAYAKDMQTVDGQTFQDAVGILKLPAPLPVSNPVSQAPQALHTGPLSRRRGKALSGLAAAMLLAVIAYTVYHRPPAPGVEETTASIPPVMTSAPGTISKEIEVLPLASKEDSPALPGKNAAGPDGVVDVGEFIKAVFLTGKSASMIQDPESPPRFEADKTPVPEIPEPRPTTAASLPPEPDPGPGASQPDTDAIIDWLIRKKSR